VSLAKAAAIEVYDLDKEAGLLGNAARTVALTAAMAPAALGVGTGTAKADSSTVHLPPTQAHHQIMKDYHGKTTSSKASFLRRINLPENTKQKLDFAEAKHRTAKYANPILKKQRGEELVAQWKKFEGDKGGFTRRGKMRKGLFRG
jgi:hypothetical protein